MASVLIISLILFSLFSSSSPFPSETIQNAAQVLSDNGLVAMSLTFELLAESLLSQSSAVTIFSPSDAAFAQSGQPSLDLLRFHFLPVYLSQGSLQSLASGTKIPTLLPGRSLTVTSSPSDSQISLNNVKINSLPFYNDGSLIIFGIEGFFDLKFKVPSPGAEFGCAPLRKNPFDEATKTLRSNGYSWMALFLESQIPGFKNNQSMMTVFAPSDDVMATQVGNFSDYPSLYFRQMSPCRILWNDLVNSEDGTEFSTYVEDYVISLRRSSSTLMINGVAVFYPDMYFNEWLVVHGLQDVFTVAERPSEESHSLTEIMSSTQEMVLDHW